MKDLRTTLYVLTRSGNDYLNQVYAKPVSMSTVEEEVLMFISDKVPIDIPPYTHFEVTKALEYLQSNDYIRLSSAVLN